MVIEIVDLSIEPTGNPLLRYEAPVPGPLATASEKSDFASVVSTTEDNPSLLNTHDAREALSHAVQNNNIGIVNYLSRKGVIPFMSDVERTIKISSYDLLPSLLRSGFDFNKPITEGRPPPLGYVSRVASSPCAPFDQDL